jgi:hypothetical protein
MFTESIGAISRSTMQVMMILFLCSLTSFLFPDDFRVQFHYFGQVCLAYLDAQILLLPQVRFMAKLSNKNVTTDSSQA